MLFWFSFLFCSPGLAANDRQEDERATAAEYTRLRQDLQRFAERKLWDAVERTYERCLSIYPDDAPTEGGWAPPNPMEQRDHLQAAHASMARGDLYTTRQRLVRALRKAETDEALEWLWSIDTTYSEVDLKGPPGVVLVAEKRPFDPVIIGSINFAQQQLEQTGAFHGLLPRLDYRLGTERFRVRGGQGLTEVDVGGEKQRKRHAKSAR